MTNTLLIIGALFATISMFSGSSTTSNDDGDDWDASEMNKEGMNYKE